MWEKIKNVNKWYGCIKIQICFCYKTYVKHVEVVQKYWEDKDEGIQDCYIFDEKCFKIININTGKFFVGKVFKTDR